MSIAARSAARLREWTSRLAGTIRPRRTDADLAAELQAHLDLATDDARRLPDSAAPSRAATLRHGAMAQTLEQFRDQRGLPWLDDFARDVRHGARFLLRTPIFTATAVLSLALGIGANSAIFSLADAALLRPLPVRNPSAIVTVAAVAANDRRSGISYPNYRDLRDISHSFDGLIAHQRVTVGFARSANAAREMRLGVLVSDNFFDVLGVGPARGRVFTAGDDGGAREEGVVIIGHDFWASALGGDASIVGQVVRINGVDLAVIGILPPDFTGLDPYIRPSFYVPAVMADRLGIRAEAPRTGTDADRSAAAPGILDDRSARTFVVKGRLKRGVSKTGARAELTTIWSGLERQYPDANQNRAIVVRSELESRMQSDPMTAIAMTMLLALVAVVLLIACANVANLMLGQARSRSREIAVRLALGVSRSRLLRQLLTESLLLALAGTAAGLAFAYGAIRIFQTFRAPSDLPIALVPHVDARVVIVSLLMAVGSALLFGLAPARHTLRTDVVPALKTSDPVQSKHRRTIGRSALVVGQVALSMVLLVATSMLLDGFRKSLLLDPGFRTDHLLMLSTNTAFARYTPAQTREFYRALVDRARALPGVASAALASSIPLDSGGAIETVIPEGHQFPPGQEHASVFASVVDDHYFDTMRTPIVHGRAFTTTDTAASPRVAIVNEEFARLYWPGQDPIGRRIRTAGVAGPLAEVVGVTKTGKYLYIGETPMPFFYLPFSQNERATMSLLVGTTSADAASLARPLGDVVRALDVNQPVFNVRTFSTFFQYRAVAVPRQLARLVGMMGLLGLTLALIGLYGLVAFSVARRTREIGIRMAIGAGKPDVVKMVLRHGAALSASGIVVGIVASAVLVRALPAALVGSGTASAATYLVISTLLIGLTLAASYVPARRAAQVDPLLAIRSD